MKNLRSIIALMLCFALVFGISSCAGNEVSEEITTEQTDEQGDIILTDQAGREVILEEPAKTIVSCYYISTYSLIALGLQNRIVGIEKKPEKRPIYKMAAPELLEKTQVGSMKEFNVEAAADLSPDLVIMPKKLIKHADTLENLGIKVLIVNPESQEDLEQMLYLIGEACGAEDKAQELISYYESRISGVSDKIKDLEKPSVYMAGNSSFLTAATDNMYQSDMIRLAGGVNAASSVKGDYWTEVSYETVLSLDPEYIILPVNAEYTKDDIMNDENLSSVRAVKNGNVYKMPSGLEEWDSPVPSSVLGVLWLTSVLHEQVYSFDNLKADVKDFYESFYGFEIDEALITK